MVVVERLVKQRLFEASHLKECKDYGDSISALL